MVSGLPGLELETAAHPGQQLKNEADNLGLRLLAEKEVIGALMTPNRAKNEPILLTPWPLFLLLCNYLSKINADLSVMGYQCFLSDSLLELRQNF